MPCACVVLSIGKLAPPNGPPDSPVPPCAGQWGHRSDVRIVDLEQAAGDKLGAEPLDHRAVRAPQRVAQAVRLALSRPMTVVSSSSSPPPAAGTTTGNSGKKVSSRTTLSRPTQLQSVHPHHRRLDEDARLVPVPAHVAAVPAGQQGRARCQRLVEELEVAVRLEHRAEPGGRVVGQASAASRATVPAGGRAPCPRWPGGRPRTWGPGKPARSR